MLYHHEQRQEQHRQRRCCSQDRVARRPVVRARQRRPRSDLLRRCHTYVVPGVEDFGIAPVEPMAAGKPVIAFRAGGATETAVDGLSFDRAAIRAQAQRFSRAEFRRKFVELLGRLGVDRELYGAG